MFVDEDTNDVKIVFLNLDSAMKELANEIIESDWPSVKIKYLSGTSVEDIIHASLT